MSDAKLRRLMGRYARSSFCFTLADGLNEAEVVSRFGAVPVPDEDEPLGEEPLIGVKRAGRWTVVLEPDSWRAAESDVLCRVSRGTIALSVHHALDSHVKFSLAEDGILLTSLVTIPPMTRKGAEPDRLLPVLRDLGLAGEPGMSPVGSSLQAVLEVVRRAFDVSFSADLWEGPFVVGEFPFYVEYRS